MLTSLNIKYMKQQILTSIINNFHMFLRQKYVMQVISTCAFKIEIFIIYKFIKFIFNLCTSAIKCKPQLAI